MEWKGLSKSVNAEKQKAITQRGKNDDEFAARA